MFNPKKPIKATQQEIDDIIAIKHRIANELQWYKWDIPKEHSRLFEKYIKQNLKLNKLTNI